MSIQNVLSPDELPVAWLGRPNRHSHVSLARLRKIKWLLCQNSKVSVWKKLKIKKRERKKEERLKKH
jgi:hypothetical protein